MSLSQVFIYLQLSHSSPEASASDEEEEINLLKVYEQQKAAHNADELVVTAAKEMGKELFAHLDFEQRKNKLDNMVSKWGELNNIIKVIAYLSVCVCVCVCLCNWIKSFVYVCWCHSFVLVLVFVVYIIC